LYLPSKRDKMSSQMLRLLEFTRAKYREELEFLCKFYKMMNV